MGAAWREVKDGPAFDGVLEMVRGVRALGMEACCTLGMLDETQAQRLAEAGLTAYNHNLDTSRRSTSQIITTRTYDDRLRTLAHVRKAGITVCSGGIIGMGESLDDRCEMLLTLANLDPQPESVPVNALAPCRRHAPLSDRPPVDPLELVRMIATARILMPKARVRLSAGRDRAHARGAGALLPRGRELDLLRREAAHHGQPRRRGRPRAAARRRAARRGRRRLDRSALLRRTQPP